MKMLFRIFSLTVVLSIVAGCGATQVSVKPDALQQLHKIALIKVAEPAAYTGSDFGSPMVYFGAVGGAVAGASSENAGKSLSDLAAEANFQAGERFTQQLSEKLAASGYQVEVITVERENGQELLENYVNVDNAGADAILDVAIGSIGYATEHPLLSPEWRPASQIHVALVDSRTHKPIYSDKFMYGYHNPFMSGTDIDAPKEYFSKDNDVLFADANRLIAGMRQSVDDVADSIAQNLHK